jgi:hypothetical protein
MSDIFAGSNAGSAKAGERLKSQQPKKQRMITNVYGLSFLLDVASILAPFLDVFRKTST